MNCYIIDLKVVYFPEQKFSNENLVLIKQLLLKNEKIIFIATDESWKDFLINGFIKDIGLEYNNPNVVLVVDHLTISQTDLIINFGNIKVYDSQLMKVASWEDEITPNTNIALDTDKFLFLMGKSYKRHRIGFLYKLYKQNIISQCEYSYKFGNRSISGITRKFLPEISKTEFLKFQNDTVRDLDNAEFLFGTTGSHYQGLPVDVNLYKNTSFSIISESVCANGEPWFLSEKTWRTIANRHMFLPLFDTPTFEYLESIGINTFQDILPIKKEKFISDVDVIIDNTIQNIRYLLSNIHLHKQYITDAVEHNYAVYRNKVDAHRSIFDIRYEEYFYSNIFSKLNYESIRKIDLDQSLVGLWSRQ